MELPLLSRADDSTGLTHLHVAVREGKYDITLLLLQYKPEIILCQDGDGNTALHFAVMQNDHKMVDLLAKESCGQQLVKILNNDGCSPFHLAATDNNVKICRLLLQLRPECCLTKTIRNQNALHLVVQKKTEEIVELIAKDKKMALYMVNQQDDDGNTPLHIAASDGNKKMLHTLSQACPAPVRLPKNNKGHTFLDISKAKEAEKRRKKRKKVLTATKGFHSSLLVMATLITTVAFTAAFTLPGGYKSDGQDQGMATLVGRAAFKVFIVADAISMSGSVIATALLALFSVITNEQKKYSILMVAIGSMVLSILAMLVAFIFGVWVVIGSECKWLAILIAVAITCAPLVVALAFGLIVVPSEREYERVDGMLGQV